MVYDDHFRFCKVAWKVLPYTILYMLRCCIQNLQIVKSYDRIIPF